MLFRNTVMSAWLPLLALSSTLTLTACDEGSATPPSSPSASTSGSTSAPKVAGPPDAEAEEKCGQKTGEEGVKCLFDLAIERQRAGKDQDALTALIRATHLAPEDLEPWARIVAAATATNNFEAASKVAALALCHLKQEELWSAHILIAGLHRDAERHGEALSHFEAAFAIDPKALTPAFNLGMAYLKQTPPRKEEGKALLELFTKDACGGNRKYVAECNHASGVLKALAGTEGKLPELKVPKAPKCDKTLKLPEITLDNKPIKSGDDFTVWGASHHLRTATLDKTVSAQDVTVVGEVVATNYGDAPGCAIFEPGSQDTPPDCEAPLPKFIIADDNKAKTRLPVVGWSSNWAQIQHVMRLLDDGDATATEQLDLFLGHKIPTPIPNVGAKVRVTGKVKFYAAIGARGPEMSPRFGLVHVTAVETLKPAPTKASLPGHPRK